MSDNFKRVFIPVLCILILAVGVGFYVYFTFTHTDSEDDNKTNVKNTLGIKSDEFYQFGDYQFQLVVEKDSNVYVINDFKINEEINTSIKKYTLSINDKEINVGDKITNIYVVDDILLVQLNNKLIGLYDRKGNELSTFTYDDDFVITGLAENDAKFKINLSRVSGKKIRINGEELDLCGYTDFSIYPELATDIYVNGEISNNEFIVEETINVNKVIESYLNSDLCN